MSVADDDGLELWEGDDEAAWEAMRDLSMRTCFGFLADEPDLYTLSDGEPA